MVVNKIAIIGRGNAGTSFLAYSEENPNISRAKINVKQIKTYIAAKLQPPLQVVVYY